MDVCKSATARAIVLGTDRGPFFPDQDPKVFISVKSLTQKNDSELIVFASQGVILLSLRDLHYLQALDLF